MNNERVYRLFDLIYLKIECSGFYKLREINNRAPKDGHRGLRVSNTSYVKFKKVKLWDKTKESTEDHLFGAYRELSKKLILPNHWYTHVHLCMRGQETSVSR